LQLAERMTGWLSNGRDVALIIGGADGLHASIKQKADWLWSLSKLTMPHGMVRVMLAEQLYRAHTVIQNHPYHRE
jgi:23S rRNA (pseudouridine1915-N3)-methyltransferase